MNIPNNTKVNHIQYRPEFSCLCSIGKRPFAGSIDIEFVPHHKLLEFMAFEEWLHSLSNQEFTVESLCDAVFDKLNEELGFITMSVTINAHTTCHANVSVTRVRDAEAEYARARAARKIATPH